MMLSANLIGFVIGTEGMMYMVKEIGGTWAGVYPLFVHACSGDTDETCRYTISRDCLLVSLCWSSVDVRVQVRQTNHYQTVLVTNTRI